MSTVAHPRPQNTDVAIAALRVCLHRLADPDAYFFFFLSFSHVLYPFRTPLEKNDSIMAFFGTKATKVATQTPQGTLMNDQFG